MLVPTKQALVVAPGKLSVWWLKSLRWDVEGEREAGCG
jgi:hypothetical protein